MLQRRPITTSPLPLRLGRPIVLSTTGRHGTFKGFAVRVILMTHILRLWLLFRARRLHCIGHLVRCQVEHRGFCMVKEGRGLLLLPMDVGRLLSWI